MSIKRANTKMVMVELTDEMLYFANLLIERGQYKDLSEIIRTCVRWTFPELHRLSKRKNKEG